MTFPIGGPIKQQKSPLYTYFMAGIKMAQARDILRSHIEVHTSGLRRKADEICKCMCVYEINTQQRHELP